MSDDAVPDNADLRAAAIAALEAKRRLAETWRARAAHSDGPSLSHEDVPLLRELITSRVEVLNAFEELLRIDADAAREVLISRYLGPQVDPDGKFGGFFFELSAMIDDWVELRGVGTLRELLLSDQVPRSRLCDQRVQESIRSGCNFDDDRDVLAWLGMDSANT